MTKHQLNSFGTAAGVAAVIALRVMTSVACIFTSLPETKSYAQ
jgi:hypothetical protein